MKAVRSSRSMILAASVAVLGAIVASAAPSTPTAAGESESRLCCVTNPGYSGVCEVELAADETCADVLAYLNNIASVGKTYCGSTAVREGWQQAECQAKDEQSGE